MFIVLIVILYNTYNLIFTTKIFYSGFCFLILWKGKGIYNLDIRFFLVKNFVVSNISVLIFPSYSR